MSEESYCFALYFESWVDSKSKIIIKTVKENIFIKNGLIVVFHPLFKRDDVLDTIDYTELVVLQCLSINGESYLFQFELEIDSQNDGYITFYFPTDILY